MRVRILVATALSEAQTLFRAQQGIVEECDAEARKLGVELAQMEREKGQFDISLQCVRETISTIPEQIEAPEQGEPDLDFPRFSAVAFVHGCFWHCHGKCKWAANPFDSNTEFWSAKLNRNAELDTRNIDSLRELGWRAGVVWERSMRLRPLKGVAESKQVVARNKAHANPSSGKAHRIIVHRNEALHPSNENPQSGSQIANGRETGRLTQAHDRLKKRCWYRSGPGKTVGVSNFFVLLASPTGFEPVLSP
jgi:G:T-mismatch repair DNA endonuclease (very short patch repair protein)